MEGDRLAPEPQRSGSTRRREPRDTRLDMHVRAASLSSTEATLPATHFGDYSHVGLDVTSGAQSVEALPVDAATASSASSVLSSASLASSASVPPSRSETPLSDSASLSSFLPVAPAEPPSLGAGGPSLVSGGRPALPKRAESMPDNARARSSGGASLSPLPQHLAVSTISESALLTVAPPVSSPSSMVAMAPVPPIRGVPLGSQNTARSLALPQPVQKPEGFAESGRRVSTTASENGSDDAGNRKMRRALDEILHECSTAAADEAVKSEQDKLPIPQRQASVPVARLLESARGFFLRAQTHARDSPERVQALGHAIEQWALVLGAKDRVTHVWGVLRALQSLGAAYRQLAAATPAALRAVDAGVCGIDGARLGDLSRPQLLARSYACSAYAWTVLFEYALAWCAALQRQEAVRRRRKGAALPAANAFQVGWLQVLAQHAKGEPAATSLTAAWLSHKAGQDAAAASAARAAAVPSASSLQSSQSKWASFLQSTISVYDRGLSVSSASSSASSSAASLPMLASLATLPPGYLPTESTAATGRWTPGETPPQSSAAGRKTPASPRLAVAAAGQLVDSSAPADEQHVALQRLAATPRMLMSPAAALHAQECVLAFVALHAGWPDDAAALRVPPEALPAGARDAALPETVWAWLDVGFNLTARWLQAYPLPAALQRRVAAALGDDGGVVAGLAAWSTDQVLVAVLRSFAENGALAVRRAAAEATERAHRRANSTPHVSSEDEERDTVSALAAFPAAGGPPLSRSRSLNAQGPASPQLAQGVVPAAPSAPADGPPAVPPVLRLSFFHGAVICFAAQLLAALAQALLHTPRHASAAAAEWLRLDREHGGAPCKVFLARELLVRASALLDVALGQQRRLLRGLQSNAGGADAAAAQLLVGESRTAVDELSVRVDAVRALVQAVFCLVPPVLCGPGAQRRRFLGGTPPPTAPSTALERLLLPPAPFGHIFSPVLSALTVKTAVLPLERLEWLWAAAPRPDVLHAWLGEVLRVVPGKSPRVEALAWAGLDAHSRAWQRAAVILVAQHLVSASQAPARAASPSGNSPQSFGAVARQAREVAEPRTALAGLAEMWGELLRLELAGGGAPCPPADAPASAAIETAPARMALEKFPQSTVFTAMGDAYLFYVRHVALQCLARSQFCALVGAQGRAEASDGELEDDLVAGLCGDATRANHANLVFVARRLMRLSQVQRVCKLHGLRAPTDSLAEMLAALPDLVVALLALGRETAVGTAPAGAAPAGCDSPARSPASPVSGAATMIGPTDTAYLLQYFSELVSLGLAGGSDA